MIDLTKFAKEFAELKNDKNINNSIVVVSKLHIYEFRSLKQEPQMFRPLYFDLETLKHLKKGPIETPITAHDGINAQF